MRTINLQHTTSSKRIRKLGSGEHPALWEPSPKSKLSKRENQTT